MKLDSLKPNASNPRKITPEKLTSLEKSLKAFGPLDGFIRNVRFDRLVGAHQRLSVMPKDSEIHVTHRFEKTTQTGTVAVGYVDVYGERFPYREVDVDQDTEMAMNLAANSHRGEWDKPRVAEWLLDLDAKGWETSALGWNNEEMEDLCAPFRPDKKGDCPDDEIPLAPRQAKTRPGDVFTLGNHRIICGDSTKKEDIEKLMGHDRADFVFTSPPYNVGLDYNSHNDSMPPEKYREFLGRVMDNIKHIQGKDIAVLWNKGSSFHACDFRMDLDLLASRWEIDRFIVWRKKGITRPPIFGHTKNNPVTKNYMPFFGWEAIFIAKIGEKGKKIIPANVLERRRTDVWEVDQSVDSSNQAGHPGAFPVQLVSDAIHLFADDVVYEPFCGSGSTLIACEKTGRRCRGVEIDPIYCDVILQRWARFTGQDPVREDGKKWSDIS